MNQNPLLAHAPLGTVKPVLFNNPPPEKVFGYTPAKDPEGAREGARCRSAWNGMEREAEVNPLCICVLQ